ncbi:IS3 family transposase [Paenibacillus alkalitolerans]|uniref:IS3 family transposase n=1 Tax=Paenibacillus alkalitolerans TaxID=2799335 RepID=UPI0018F4071C|nr:IS3 family transposase [Paenibacillus alkalitolerans]
MMKSRIKFSAEDLQQLKDNPNIQQVSEKSISYSSAFKLAAVLAYNDGVTPLEIFINGGFDTAVIGPKTPKWCLKRWRTTFAKYGEEALLEERRGKGSSGRKPAGEMSVEEKLKKAEARIKLLQAENELLKKLEALERKNRNALSSSERFQLIEQVVRKYRLKRMTRYLCELAEVSRSGYYSWLSAQEHRQQQEHIDEHDFQLVKSHFNSLDGKAGALVIKMRLEKIDGIVMNHKKIRRLMRKYRLVAKIRQANPYRKMAKATQEHSTCPNLLDRCFDQGEPAKVLLTDITYMRYGRGQWAYLSCVKDGTTKEILAHFLSSSLELSIVERTLDLLSDRLAGNVHSQAIFHSDQGMHYTHPRIRKLVKKNGFKQSMSRKGNCWDNASMESFFGHLKDDLDYRHCDTIEELRICVDEYVQYYNTERYQWSLKKMTPEEYRNHLLAA